MGHIAKKILTLTHKSAKGKPEMAYWLKDAVKPEDVRPQRIIEAFADHAVFDTLRVDEETLRTPRGAWDPCFLQLCAQTNLGKAKVFKWYQEVMACESLNAMPLLKQFYPEPPSTNVTIDGKICGPPIVSADSKDFPLPAPDSKETPKEKTPVPPTPAPKPPPKKSTGAPITPQTASPPLAPPTEASNTTPGADDARVCRAQFYDRKCELGENVCPHLHTWPNACLNHFNGKCTRKPCKFRHLSLSERPPRAPKGKNGKGAKTSPSVQTTGAKAPVAAPDSKAEKKMPVKTAQETIVTTIVVKLPAKAKTGKSKQSKLPKDPETAPAKPKAVKASVPIKAPSSPKPTAPGKTHKFSLKAWLKRNDDFDDEGMPLLSGEPPPIYEDGSFIDERWEDILSAKSEIREGDRVLCDKDIQEQGALLAKFSGCNSSGVVTDPPTHSVNSDAPPPTPASDKPGLLTAPVPPQVPKPICCRWFKDKCPRKVCKFAHSKQGVCHKFLEGGCTAKQCKFKHVPLSVEA